VVLLKKVKEKIPVLSEVLNEAGIASIPLATPVAAPTIPPNPATELHVSTLFQVHRRERNGVLKVIVE